MATTTNKKENATSKSDQAESLKLEKAYTYFMIPFYFEGNDYKILKVGDCPSESMWEKAKEKILKEDDDVLYPYIINFIQGQTNNTTNQFDHLDIYSINSDPKSPARKFWDSFSKKPDAENTKKKTKKEGEECTCLHQTEIEWGKDEDNKSIFKTIEFDLQRDNGYAGFKSPHLFISPSANIGILTFCIGLGKNNNSIDDLKRLNYHLHKIGKPLNKCVTNSFQLKKQTFANENVRISKENRIMGFRQLIHPHDEKENLYNPYYEFSWNIRTLISMLLSDVKGVKQENGWVREQGVQLFSDTRAHLFTFYQIDGIQYPCGFNNVKLDLMRLSRCVNDKYILPTDVDVEKEMCIKTFDNIYFASSVEGASMIAVATQENADYIKQIDHQGLPRYLAIYLLVMIQRYSMLHINRQLTELETDISETPLWNILNTIKKVKVHCYYTDVSPYTQHNQFYQHCNKNLHIRETFNEIDNKTKILNLTISHDMQKLLEEQKETIELQRAEEARREKALQELEKKREKSLRIAEQKAESGQHRLNLVVGILTLFQVAGVIHQFTVKTWYQWWAVAFIFVISLILLFIVVNWEKEDNLIVKWIRNIYYRKNNDQLSTGK